MSDAQQKCAEHICQDLMPRGTPRTFGALVYLCEQHGGTPLIDPVIPADRGGRCVGGEIILSPHCSLSDYQEIIPHELVHRLADEPRWEGLNRLTPWPAPNRLAYLEEVATRVGLMARGPAVTRPGFTHISDIAYQVRERMARASSDRVRIKGYIERLQAEKLATMERRRHIRYNQPDYAKPYIGFLQDLAAYDAINCLVLSTDAQERPTATFYAGQTDAMLDLSFPSEALCRLRLCTGENGEVMEFAVDTDESTLEQHFSAIAAFVGRCEGRFEDLQ
jgi:hypothetical protein